MKNNVVLAIALATGSIMSAQVGINTKDPKSTMDVAVKRDSSGNITDTNQVIGLQAPRLSLAELTLNTATYAADQKGALIYITDISGGNTTGQRVNIKSNGYYYFDGALWQILGSEIDGVIGNEILNATANSGLIRTGGGTAANPYTLGLLKGTVNGQVMTWNAGKWNPADITNIYNNDGVLTNPRTVTQNGNNLTFTNTQKTSIINDAGTGIVQDSGTGTRASISLSNDGDSQLWLFTDTDNAAQVFARGRSTSLEIGTNATSTSAPISFSTSSGKGAAANQRAEIDGMGKFNIVNTLSVGYSNQQTFTDNQKLKVNGSIATISAVYPDYVFEDYYTGVSKLKSDYKFKSIYDIEKFIIENKHLPGVTPASSLEKTEHGYSYNLTDLSVQSLEKIEELYLHTIRQQKQIDNQKLQIEKLLKLTEGLEAEVSTLKK